MEIELHINKSVDENASLYYEKAKKSKKKLEGINKAIGSAEKKLEDETLRIAEKEKIEEEKTKPPRKKEWYEKFHWFFTSRGKLVIGGRDATTNEAIVKKYTDKGDLVFHTDMAGSPFVVIKADGADVENIEKEEAAEFLACYSKAWKAGISSVEVFYVNPDQVTKEAQSGEYLPKGSFMIRGKTKYIGATLRLAVTVHDDIVYAGPISAIRTLIESKIPDLTREDVDKKYVRIVQGREKSSQVAKQIKKYFGGDLDDIIRVLPPGGCRIGK